MEQMYLIEIFVDKVTIFATDEDIKSGANKNLIIKIKFGPKVQFIIKEGQLALNTDNIIEKKDDILECDRRGRRKWTRTIRIGKSYLFPSYPDIVMMILNKFPLEIEVWNDDEYEVEIFVGIGTMHWHTQFIQMLKETTKTSKLHQPLAIKQVTPLYAECCCKQCGEIEFILRLSALGETIITEFQQLMKDPESFVFRTNKAPSMFQCKRVEGNDPNFCMVGSLYETTTLEDPDVLNTAQQKIEICTEFQSCGVEKKGVAYTCGHDKKGEKEENKKKKDCPIDKIRMGDITGPCGNTTCPLAHKVKNYIRNLDSYKAAAKGITTTKDNASNRFCGKCYCKDDRWHREDCPSKQVQDETYKKSECKDCGGTTKYGDTCEDRKNKMYGTGATPKGSKTQVAAYVLSVTKIPGFYESMRRQNFVIENVTTNINQLNSNTKKTCTNSNFTSEPGCQRSEVAQIPIATEDAQSQSDFKSSTRSLRTNNQLVYNVETKDTKTKTTVDTNTDTTDNKDCKCNPPKPTPPCKTFDCDCLSETLNIAARKAHKSYCPLYKHKINCPVNMIVNDEEENKKVEDEEDEAEPLPYGLPPIQLGPCPVIGRPCTVPDGFARMYRTAVLPTQPPSFSDAGKVCCSKEYERIKKAIKEYTLKKKEDDYKCINKFNVDTERRCCDKEQTLLSLMGRECCGSHKLAIQEKFKEEEK